MAFQINIVDVRVQPCLILIPSSCHCPILTCGFTFGNLLMQSRLRCNIQTRHSRLKIDDLLGTRLLRHKVHLKVFTAEVTFVCMPFLMEVWFFTCQNQGHKSQNINRKLFVQFPNALLRQYPERLMVVYRACHQIDR